MVRLWLHIGVIAVCLWANVVSHAQSTIIYQDDFEGTVAGWSNNSTEFDPDVTRFLGRFDNNPNTTSRTFTIPAGSDKVEIQFDFYRFDSWDNTAQWGFDRFEVDIDGTEIFSLPFSTIPQGARSGTTGNVDWSHIPLTGKVELAFGSGQWWFDQLHQFTITVNNPGTTLDLTLRTDLNQGGNDESGGYDNMTVTAFTPVLPNLAVVKTVDTVDMAYAIPGNFVEYTINIQNTGGPVDDSTINLVDYLPSNVTLFTGDLDGLGNPVIFEDNSTPVSGLTCCQMVHLDYSDTASGAPVFGYIPAIPYDPNVTHIRIKPAGILRDSQTDISDVSYKFRALIE